MASPEPKGQKKHPTYTLLYHPGIPGRGEFVRLAFEATGIPYSDAGNESKERVGEIYAACSPKSTGEGGNPPCFAPPMLRVDTGGNGGETFLISQTSNILLYLGPILGLAGEQEVDRYHINQLTLTALDLNNEVHDTHHPIATMKTYEEQKDSALLKSQDFRENRIPKFFSYFERTLKGNERGHGHHLIGNKLTYADLTLWQVIDG